MKFNPLTNELYTDTGKLIKEMYCPIKASWDRLEFDSKGPISKKCITCSKPVIDANLLSEEELLKIMSENPATCLKIDINHSNIEFITNGLNKES